MFDQTPLTIRPLSPQDDHNGDIDLMARWLFDLWGDYDPDETLATCRADLAKSLNPAAQIPKTFVCHQNGALVGWASIIASDIYDRPDLGPWLANVTVLPDFRGQGIARRLTGHVMDYAKDVTQTLYLYTDNLQATYQSMGWKQTDTLTINGHPVTLMMWDTER